ncbi:hypothetical protein R0135_00560 [Congregibacter variabilis]|uniref:Uncharacterized protein n=1 Tax=Congregibacter variabilis TaxID=3081200 RepID=A0ABZ0I592_9GAMM|nr:hypothetical protein R0135_00560 [Congregibacter sp. IMCC43200]
MSMNPNTSQQRRQAVTANDLMKGYDWGEQTELVRSMLTKFMAMSADGQQRLVDLLDAKRIKESAQ